MNRMTILLDVKTVILYSYDSSFIIIQIAIIRSTENSNHCREIALVIPFVHFVPFQLSLMCSDDT